MDYRRYVSYKPEGEGTEMKPLADGQTKILI